MRTPREFLKHLMILLLSGVTALPVSCHGPGCERLRVSYFDVSRPLPVMSCGLATEHDLVSFLLETNPQADVSEVSTIARHYIEESLIEGVNHDIAFCQMCVETNFLRFTGDVHRRQNNFAGIGATGGVPGDSFESVQIGIRAQIQHLKAYASRRRLRRRLVDPRFAKVRRSSARHVEDLSGRWAIDPHYGAKIREKLQLLTKWIYDADDLAEDPHNKRNLAGRMRVEAVAP
jgi:hypothetical protein